MTNHKSPEFNAFLPILLIFVLTSALSVVFGGYLRSRNIDQVLIIAGNLTLFAVTSVTFLLHRKALVAGNTQVFLRNVNGGMFVKFFICLIAAFIYIFLAGSAVNKTGLFIVMFLYLLYSFTEVAILLKYSKQLKQNNNA